MLRRPSVRPTGAALSANIRRLPSCNDVVWLGTRRPASRYAVPQRQASRGVLRVGAWCSRTELCRGEPGFSSTEPLADLKSARPLYLCDLRNFKSSVGCTGQATKGDQTRW